jgi:hypothetical protein
MKLLFISIVFSIANMEIKIEICIQKLIYLNIF